MERRMRHRERRLEWREEHTEQVKRWAVRVLEGSLLGVFIPNHHQEEPQDEGLSPLMAIGSDLSCALGTAGVDAAGWMALTNGYKHIIGDNDTAVHIASWATQSLLKELKGEVTEASLDIKYKMRRSLSKRAAKIMSNTVLEVSKNTASMLAVQYIPPHLTQWFPSLSESPRKLQILSSTLVPFGAMLATETVLRQAPPLGPTVVNFLWFALVQSAFSPHPQPPLGPPPLQIMGLPSTATPAQIQSRYRTVALALHPDNAGTHPPPDLKGAEFGDFTRAYNQLMKTRGGRGTR
eukprot:TRINITY_DN15732_c0_g1_i1.p1 TRINITY_DN15732_c0_g1~~TRINITY_DN15732_c0_g1_i1.p1  ORF type:complete len:293 (+),score=27.07 TRINITY_DN15732_c0_g1_i1:186-1064(+)